MSSTRRTKLLKLFGSFVKMRLYHTGIFLLLFEGGMTFFPFEEHLWFLPLASVPIKQFFVLKNIYQWYTNLLGNELFLFQSSAVPSDYWLTIIK